MLHAGAAVLETCVMPFLRVEWLVMAYSVQIDHRRLGESAARQKSSQGQISSEIPFHLFNHKHALLPPEIILDLGRRLGSWNWELGIAQNHPRPRQNQSLIRVVSKYRLGPHTSALPMAKPRAKIKVKARL